MANNPPIDDQKTPGQLAWELEVAEELRRLSAQPPPTGQLTGSQNVPDTDTEGRIIATFNIYRRFDGTPARPNSTTYSQVTNSFTVPDGWSDAIPAGDDELFLSSASVNSEESSITLSWSAPVPLEGTPGMDGEAGASISVSQSKVDGVTTVTFTSTDPDVTPVTSTIDDGESGASSFTLYSATAAGSDISTTRGTREYAGWYDTEALPADLSTLADQIDWAKIVGTDGAGATTYLLYAETADGTNQSFDRLTAASSDTELKILDAVTSINNIKFDTSQNITLSTPTDNVRDINFTLDTDFADHGNPLGASGRYTVDFFQAFGEDVYSSIYDGVITYSEGPFKSSGLSDNLKTAATFGDAGLQILDWTDPEYIGIMFAVNSASGVNFNDATWDTITDTTTEEFAWEDGQTYTIQVWDTDYNHADATVQASYTVTLQVPSPIPDGNGGIFSYGRASDFDRDSLATDKALNIRTYSGSGQPVTVSTPAGNAVRDDATYVDGNNPGWAANRWTLHTPEGYRRTNVQLPKAGQTDVSSSFSGNSTVTIDPDDSFGSTNRRIITKDTKAVTRDYVGTFTKLSAGPPTLDTDVDNWSTNRDPRTRGTIIYNYGTSAPSVPEAGDLTWDWDSERFTTLPGNWRERPYGVKELNNGESAYRLRIIVSEDYYLGPTGFLFDTVYSDVLVVNDIVSENYNGLRDTDIQSYLDDTNNTEGYYLDAEHGIGIFQNAIIRGDSTVETANITGEPHIPMGLTEGQAFNNQVDNATFAIGASGFGTKVGVITGVESLRVDSICMTYHRSGNTGSQGIEFLSGTLTYALHDTISTGTRGNPNGTTPITRTLNGGSQFTFNNVTTTQGVNMLQSSGFGSTGHLSFTGLDPQRTYELYMFSSGSNFRMNTPGTTTSLVINGFESTIQTSGFGTADKADLSTAAYIVGDNDTEFAMTAIGGLGVKIPSILMWDGDAQEAFLPYRNPLNLGAIHTADNNIIQPDAQLVVEVSWGSDLWAVVPVTVTPSDYAYLTANVANSSGYNEIVGPEIRDASGNRVGTLILNQARTGTTLNGVNISGVLRSIEINRTSGQSTATIRRVWRKFA